MSTEDATGLIHERMSQLAERDAFHTLESGNLFDPVNRDVYEQDTAGAVADFKTEGLELGKSFRGGKRNNSKTSESRRGLREPLCIR